MREYALFLNDAVGGEHICVESLEEELAGLPGDYAEPAGTVLLAFENEIPAGCVALKPLKLTESSRPNERACEMKRLWVRPRAQGTGLGRQLAEAIIDLARQRGYTAMYLDTMPQSMQAAYRLYCALGFTAVDRYTPEPRPPAGGRARNRLPAQGAVMGSPLPILNQPRPHEAFHSARELETRLRARVRGEVRFDQASRALYATDASNYRQTPIGVVLPRDAEDVEATIAACRELGAAILPRGAGTSLAGQCCNVAVILDFSKYMRRLVSLDPDAKAGASSSRASCSIACAKPPRSITSPSLPIRPRTAAARSAA